jgi:AcrR family transcriptional regulator
MSKTKRSILEISEKLFAEKGFDKTGINEIAEGAGIAKSVIYHHFKNKDDILQMLIKSISEELIELKRSIKDNRPEHSDNAVETTLKELLAFWEKHSRIANIILTESLKNSNEIPLFALWDNNTAHPADFLKSDLHLTPDEILQTMEGAFFLMFMPTYCFAIFEDEWCKHYDIDSATARQSFISLMTETCKNKIWLKR